MHRFTRFDMFLTQELQVSISDVYSGYACCMLAAGLNTTLSREELEAHLLHFEELLASFKSTIEEDALELEGHHCSLIILRVVMPYACTYF